MNGFKKIIICVLSAMLACVLMACNSHIDDPNNEILLNPDATTPADYNNGSGEGVGTDKGTLPIEIDRNRTTWNIELTVKEITEDRVYFYIIDHDNKGFIFDPTFYNLERWIDGEWVAITNHKNPMSWEYYMEFVPNPDADFAIVLNHIDFTMLYDRSIIVPGKYRAIQYFNDREFYLEFELD